MIPSVNLTILDGALGIIPPSFGDICAVVGTATKGPLTPVAFARTKDVQTTFGYGPLVEAACYLIERVGKPVVLCRSAAAASGSYSALTVNFDVTSTCVPTADGTALPIDEVDAVWTVVKGGTISTAGITFQWSLDGGRTMSPITALGTANSFTFPGTNGSIKLDFAAGTVKAGDTLSFSTTAPQPTSTEYGAALTALQSTGLSWAFVLLAFPLAAADVTAIDTAMEGMRTAVGKFKFAMGNTRRPTAGETEATYLTSLTTAFASSSSLRLSLWAGYAKTLSSVSRFNQKRPAAWGAAGRTTSVTAQIDLAEIDLGPLPGVQIADDNQNPDDHDETIYPGLDDQRFGTLRSVEGYQGTYINNPRIIAPTGSDFVFVQYRRVMDIGCATVRAALVKRLSKAVKLDKKTGFILESEARDIEAGVNAALRTALIAKGFATDASFVLSRTDNILSTLTLTGDARIVPLGYPKFFNVTIGYNNPALRTSVVG